MERSLKKLLNHCFSMGIEKGYKGKNVDAIQLEMRGKTLQELRFLTANDNDRLVKMAQEELSRRGTLGAKKRKGGGGVKKNSDEHFSQKELGKSFRETETWVRLYWEHFNHLKKTNSVLNKNGEMVKNGDEDWEETLHLEAEQMADVQYAMIEKQRVMEESRR